MRREPPIGEVLTEFAGLDALRLMTGDPDEIESNLQLAALAWNAVLLADQAAAEARARGEGYDGGDIAFESVIAQLVSDVVKGAGVPFETIDLLVRRLVVRKLEEFGDDQRGIGDLRLERAGRSLRVVVSSI